MYSIPSPSRSPRRVTLSLPQWSLTLSIDRRIKNMRATSAEIFPRVLLDRRPLTPSLIVLSCTLGPLGIFKYYICYKFKGSGLLCPRSPFSKLLASLPSDFSFARRRGTQAHHVLWLKRRDKSGDVLMSWRKKHLHLSHLLEGGWCLSTLCASSPPLQVQARSCVHCSGDWKRHGNVLYTPPLDSPHTASLFSLEEHIYYQSASWEVSLSTSFHNYIDP